MAVEMRTFTVTSTTYSAISAPTWDPGFTGAVAFGRVSGTPDVYISFDGVNDKGRLVDGKINQINYQRDYQKMWLRLGSAGTADVEIIIESRG